MPRIQVRVRVSGRVQGVSYRAYAIEQAKLLDLVGWVRNLPDGRVEAVVQGEATAVDQMIAWTQKGSPNAKVDLVQVEPEPLEPFEGFELRR